MDSASAGSPLESPDDIEIPGAASLSQSLDRQGDLEPYGGGGVPNAAHNQLHALAMMRLPDDPLELGYVALQVNDLITTASTSGAQLNADDVFSDQTIADSVTVLDNPDPSALEDLLKRVLDEQGASIELRAAADFYLTEVSPRVERLRLVANASPAPAHAALVPAEPAPERKLRGRRAHARDQERTAPVRVVTEH